MQKAYNKTGITSAFDRSQGPDGFRAYQEVRAAGEMTVRTNVTYYIGAKGEPKDVADEIRRIPFVTGWGDEWLRVGSAQDHRGRRHSDRHRPTCASLTA